MVSNTLRGDLVYSPDKSFISFLKEKSNILRSDAYWSFGGKKKEKKKKRQFGLMCSNWMLTIYILYKADYICIAYYILCMSLA